MSDSRNNSSLHGFAGAGDGSAVAAGPARGTAPRESASARPTAGARRGSRAGSASRADAAGRAGTGRSGTRSKRNPGGFFGRRSAGARHGDDEHARDGGARHGSHAPSVLRYAQDNAFVQAVSSFTTGPTRPLFILLVVAAVGVGLYFPVRDLYIAYRSQILLEEQIAIREAYNALLEEEVEQLLSEEGIQTVARKELGMVMEGETALIVTGLDEDGNPIVESEDDGSTEEASDEDGESDESASDEDSTPTTSTEVKAAEEAVYENSAWYWKMLDKLFFFDGTGAQVVVSTGE